MKKLIRALAIGASALAVVAATGTAASADSPVTLEPYEFEFSEQDALMTQACGFPVQVTVLATGIDRSFDPRPGGLAYLGTQRTDIKFSVGDNTVTFRERGQERAVANPDGTVSFSYTGRFFGQDVVGRLVIDPVTEEIISRTGTSVDYGRLCAALSG